MRELRGAHGISSSSSSADMVVGGWWGEAVEIFSWHMYQAEGGRVT